MEKHQLTLPEEFIRYCRLNGKDVQKEAARIFEKGFTLDKYGAAPTTTQNIEEKRGKSYAEMLAEKDAYENELAIKAMKKMLEKKSAESEEKRIEKNAAEDVKTITQRLKNTEPDIYGD